MEALLNFLLILGSLSLENNAPESKVTCEASWYELDGNQMANGDVFNSEALTAAHPSLPFGTRVIVAPSNSGIYENGHRSVEVEITDRGPYVGDRCIDLSRSAFDVIGNLDSGTMEVTLDTDE